MPTYEYSCSSCGATHEIVQKMSDATLTVCPDCGQETLRKLFNNVGVMFKGSGFYRNDSRGSSEGGSTPKAAGSDSSSPTPAPAASAPAPASTSTSASSSSSSSSD
ncbi:MAG: zinc ribbon domain-containing protein [Actinomycetota bacterium]|nr:zinc ribbon domain-containing protein [Actinomycetota bacterium]